jgi:hypothetical protein
MGKSVFINSGIIALAIIMLCGCQILGLGPSDEELVNTTMVKWRTALIAHDMDKFMETYSENYTSTQGGNKNSVREFVTGVIDQGYLDNLEVNLEDAQITIESEVATVAPIELTSDTGTYVLEYAKLQKENGVWLIVSSKTQEQ